MKEYASSPNLFCFQLTPPYSLNNEVFCKMGNGVRKVRRFAAKSSDALWLEVFNLY